MIEIYILLHITQTRGVLSITTIFFSLFAIASFDL